MGALKWTQTDGGQHIAVLGTAAHGVQYRITEHAVGTLFRGARWQVEFIQYSNGALDARLLAEGFGTLEDAKRGAEALNTINGGF